MEMQHLFSVGTAAHRPKDQKPQVPSTRPALVRSPLAPRESAGYVEARGDLVSLYEADEMGQAWLGRIKAMERLEARMETLQQVVQRAILVRFPEAPPDLASRAEEIQSVRALESLHGRVIGAESLEEVERLVRGE